MNSIRPNRVMLIMRNLIIRLAACAVAASGSASWAQAPGKVDFVKQIQPLLEVYCVKCHGPERPKGGLRLDSLAGALKGGEKGTALVPGKPQASPLYASTILPP